MRLSRGMERKGMQFAVLTVWELHHDRTGEQYDFTKNNTGWETGQSPSVARNFSSVAWNENVGKDSLVTLNLPSSETS